MQGRHTATDEEGVLEEVYTAAVTACSAGDSFLSSGLFEKAIESYERAIEFCPNSVLGYHSLAEVYHAQGQSLLAVAYYSLAIQWDVSNAELYCSRGAANYSLGEYGQALSDFEKAIEINPKHQKAQSYLSLINNSVIDQQVNLSATSLTDEERQHQKSKEKEEIKEEIKEENTITEEKQTQQLAIKENGNVSLGKTGLFKPDGTVTFSKVDPKEYLARKNMSMNWYYNCKK
jgi:tetratricopeptide (TPR) repeat protein